MTCNVFGGTLSLAQSINVQSNTYGACLYGQRCIILWRVLLITICRIRCLTW